MALLVFRAATVKQLAGLELGWVALEAPVMEALRVLIDECPLLISTPKLLLTLSTSMVISIKQWAFDYE
jgi:hypothetical protein